jgi:hypothetical protein
MSCMSESRVCPNPGHSAAVFVANVVAVRSYPIENSYFTLCAFGALQSPAIFFLHQLRGTLGT